MLQIAHLHERSNVVFSLNGSAELPAPRLALEATGTLEGFSSSLLALVQGPAAPKRFTGVAYFRDCWIDQRFPKYAFVAAIVLQALLILFPPPIWNVRSARTVSAAPQAEIEWYGPAKDFPTMLPAFRARKTVPRGDTSKTTPRRGADAFHPGQTILSEPLHPTHPRQTLIQPKAPQEPPKILPSLPNIVQLAIAQPERPKLQLTAKEFSSLRPKTRLSHADAEIAAPEISAQEKQAGAINIASSPQSAAKPLLPVNPMSAPHSTPKKTEANAAAPEIGASAAENETLIALSATPAPTAPPPAIPAGNLLARLSISRDASQPGTPGALASGEGASGGSVSAGAGHGPEGIFVGGGNRANTSTTSGLGIGPDSRGAIGALPSRPVSRARIAPAESKSLPADAEGAALTAPKLGLSAQEVLGAKRIYTLQLNMPNFTSASGSWILNFAELNEATSAGHVNPANSGISGPVALRKVDPKYPPELRTSHVDGEVLLYAIIRKDGSVDSIQLVHGVDPRLDANAMEALAQWKFSPAEKHGEPVDIEAVVHIPFRSRAPGF